MSAWWEQGYPGGPAVGPKFIRPLYPPDAAKRGKTPSTPGKDVEAVKRAISRGGHWLWQEFDRTYSNGFAHGLSGNVRESGLAGAQRQNGIDASGWMGEATYNMLRCARVPAGLPHAGEPLVDATAVRLLEEFAEEYRGNQSSIRAAALAEAKQWLGYTESPAGSNSNTFGVWYGMNYEPWCAMFVTYCYELGGPSPSFVKGSRYSYCQYIYTDAAEHRNGLTLTSSPIPGDVVLYDWDQSSSSVFDHVGIFEDGSASQWTAIEGNTSTSNQSNGGQVMRRSRSKSDARVAFVRVAE